MGNSSSSRVSVLNDLIQKTTNDVMVSVSTNVATVSTTDQSIEISGNTSLFSFMKADQSSEINIKIFQDANVNMELVSKLTSELSNKLLQAQAQQPSLFSSPLSSSSTATDITNKVQQIVEMRVGIKSNVTIFNNIDTTQTVNFVNNFNLGSALVATQRLKIVQDVSNKLAADIVTAVTGETVSETDIEQINASAVTAQKMMKYVFLIVMVIVVGVVAYFVSSRSSTSSSG